MAEDSTRQGNLDTACSGLRPTTGHNGCLMMMMMMMIHHGLHETCMLTDFYSDEDITAAKSILYDTAFCSRDTPRLIKHKGKDKNINNIQDINIFLEMPPSSLPSYDAKDLSHLPPLQ